MGASYKTLIAGWVAIIADLAGLVAKAVEQNGVPTDSSTWLIFFSVLATGVVGILAKDYDKSNAPVPVAEARPVPPTP